MTPTELIILLGGIIGNVIVLLVRTMLSERALLKELTEVRREVQTLHELLTKHDHAATVYIASTGHVAKKN